MPRVPAPIRHLCIVFGDQLNADSALFDDFDDDRDVIFMAEAAGEATQVPSHKQRIALFLAAMRHFRDERRAEGRPVCYAALDDESNCGRLSGEIRRAAEALKPQRIRCVQPGEWRVQHGLQVVAGQLDTALDILPDRHFLCPPEDFTNHAEGRKTLRLEYFYREMRKRHAVLLDEDGKPEGGSWNYDADNRESFSRTGPGELPQALRFEPDDITRAVLDLVEERFPDHPGSLDSFAWPVTATDARRALDDFITERLPNFGKYQDALWAGEPFLYHSLLSAALNLKLLDPRDAVIAAEKAYREDRAPLNAAEGFIRQILGWREYVRGIYWRFMPGYGERNHLKATSSLPDFYWDGDTPMACLRDVIEQVLDHGYSHHIQRLMVTGLYALLLGVRPQEVHEWFLAVHVDAVEWVELPNTLGMSQFGDGGIMASKPYAASGKYIDRMSNFCDDCPFDPAEATGDRACPYTTLYWDFLLRNRERLDGNRRFSLQLRNSDRLSDSRKKAIRQRAARIAEDPSGRGLLC